jgi:hypothetical protein
LIIEVVLEALRIDRLSEPLLDTFLEFPDTKAGLLIGKFDHDGVSDPFVRPCSKDRPPRRITSSRPRKASQLQLQESRK